MKAFRIALYAAALAGLTAASLPEEGPLPTPRPDGGREEVPVVAAPPTPEPKPETKPIPEPKPDQKPADPAKARTVEDAPPANQNGTESKDVPLRQPGDTAPPPTPGNEPDTGTEPAAPAGPPLTIADEPEADHQQCEKELTEIGATFNDVPRIDDGDGCGIDRPITLTEALPGIKVKPSGTMRCEAALALARWMKQSVIPAGEAALKDAGKITTINQASTYTCRLRNNAKTGKISEHARGNAIDVASFTFQNGTVVAVEPRKEDSTLTGAFQRSVSASGCLYFSTVLDPESDAAHEHHFHLDVMKRNGGFRYCH